MNIERDYYKDNIRAKFKDIRKVGRRDPRAIERESLYILSALLRLTRSRTVDWRNLSTAQQTQVELDFVSVLVDFLDFNNRHCPQSLRLGLRELEGEEE